MDRVIKVLVILAVVVVLVIFVTVPRRNRRQNTEQLADVSDTTEMVEQSVDTVEEEEPAVEGIKFYALKDSYRVGESIDLGVMSDTDGYVYIFSADDRGHIILLFPNKIEQNNRAYAHKEFTTGESVFYAKRPGKEIVYLLFTDRQLPGSAERMPLSQLVYSLGSDMEEEDVRELNWKLLKLTLDIQPKAG